MSGLDIIVVGGGIGGCAAALALWKSGNTNVRLFEAVPELKPLGVGM